MAMMEITEAPISPERAVMSASTRGSGCVVTYVLAHALGAGAVVAGRDLEGVGETLLEAGQL